MRGQRRRYPQPARRLQHLRAPDVFGHPHRRRIERARDGFAQGDLAAEIAGEIARRPAVDGNRRVDHRSIGGHAGLEGGQIDDRLERRTGLPQRLGRPVELAGGIIAAADHGADRAVGRHGDQRDLCSAAVCIGDGSRGEALQARAQRGVDHQVAAAPGNAGRPLQHPIGEIAAVLAATRPLPACRHAPRLRAVAAEPLRLRVGEKAGFHHGVQDDLGARLRGGAIVRRIKARRRAQQAGQNGRLVNVDIARRHAEIAL